MSLLTQQTTVAPGLYFSSLQAAVNSAGGGGGSVGNTLTLSTLTFGVGVDANANNILAQTGTVAIAATGDNNQIQIAQIGNDPTLGNQYALQGNYANGAAGDITFGDINGNGSALTAINYQSAGLVSGNISTFIYGSTEIKPDGSGKGSQLYVSSLNISSINNQAYPPPAASIPSTFTNITVSTSAGQPGSLYIQGVDNTLYSMFVSSVAYPTTSMSLGFQNTRNEVYTSVLEAPDFYTSTIKGATGQISLNPNGTDQIVIGGLGAPGDISLATSGGGQINLKGTTNVTSGSLNVPATASISSLTVSSINGGSPAGTLPTAFTSGAMSNYFQGNSSGGGTMFDLQDPFPSPFTYSVQNWITINGAAKAIIDFSGSGNTNNLRDSNAGSGPAHLDMSLYWDNNDNNFQQFIISSWDSTAALSGSFGPTTSLPAAGAISTASTAFPGTFMYTTDPISGSAAFTATLFGKRTVKLKTNANIFLNSGDNTENYTLTIRAPYQDSANTAVFSVNQG